MHSPKQIQREEMSRTGGQRIPGRQQVSSPSTDPNSENHPSSAVEPMWHMQDSPGQMLALAFRWMSWKPSKLLLLCLEVDPTTREHLCFAGVQCRSKVNLSGNGPARVAWNLWVHRLLTSNSFLRLIDFCVTQLFAQGPSRTFSSVLKRRKKSFDSRIWRPGRLEALFGGFQGGVDP